MFCGPEIVDVSLGFASGTIIVFTVLISLKAPWYEAVR